MQIKYYQEPAQHFTLAFTAPIPFVIYLIIYTENLT